MASYAIIFYPAGGATFFESIRKLYIIFTSRYIDRSGLEQVRGKVIYFSLFGNGISINNYCTNRVPDNPHKGIDKIPHPYHSFTPLRKWKPVKTGQIHFF